MEYLQMQTRIQNYTLRPISCRDGENVSDDNKQTYQVECSKPKPLRKNQFPTGKNQVIFEKFGPRSDPGL